jgi:hypothetical protein
MATQSSTTTLENCLPAMDYLLSLFEEAKTRYGNDPFMASRVNSAWSKLDKYYTKTNDSAAYVAALVLDPCMKWEYTQPGSQNGSRMLRPWLCNYGRSIALLVIQLMI